MLVFTFVVILNEIYKYLVVSAAALVVVVLFTLFWLYSLIALNCPQNETCTSKIYELRMCVCADAVCFGSQMSCTKILAIPERLRHTNFDGILRLILLQKKNGRGIKII